VRQWTVGLSKVGIPGAPVGIQPRDVTIAQALKPLRCATGQFGYPPSQTPASFTIDQIQEGVDKRIEQKQKKR
jgi:hypothetical protein